MDVHNSLVEREGRPVRRHRRRRRRLPGAARSGDRRRDHGCPEMGVPRGARGPGAEGAPPGGKAPPRGRGGGPPTPPFPTPVSALTHHTRPSIEMEGGTTYHFLDVPPAEALEPARGAAVGKERPEGRAC